MTGGATGGGVGATGVFEQLAASAPARNANPSRAAGSVLVKLCRSLKFRNVRPEIVAEEAGDLEGRLPRACRFGHRSAAVGLPGASLTRTNNQNE